MRCRRPRALPPFALASELGTNCIAQLAPLHETMGTKSPGAGTALLATHPDPCAPRPRGFAPPRWPGGRWPRAPTHAHRVRTAQQPGHPTPAPVAALPTAPTPFTTHRTDRPSATGSLFRRAVLLNTVSAQASGARTQAILRAARPLSCLFLVLLPDHQPPIRPVSNALGRQEQ